MEGKWGINLTWPNMLGVLPRLSGYWFASWRRWIGKTNCFSFRGSLSRYFTPELLHVFTFLSFSTLSLFPEGCFQRFIFFNPGNFDYVILPPIEALFKILLIFKCALSVRCSNTRLKQLVPIEHGWNVQKNWRIAQLDLRFLSWLMMLRYWIWGH